MNGSAEGSTVLVADDEPHVLRMMEHLLRKMGCDVLTAPDGEEALTQIRARRPELAIVDGSMPIRSGYEVSEALRDDPGDERRPYVMMLTAGGRDLDRARAEAAGIDEFVTKPFSPSKLRARVSEILEGGS